MISDVLDQKSVDEVVPVYDEHAYGYARRYATKGYLVGPSSGAVLYAVEQWAPKLKEGDLAVCILADSGRAYLSKMFSIQMSEADLEAYRDEMQADGSPRPHSEPLTH